jgi:predicted ATPase/DNA-binding CsgD family transcriptional regulator
VSVRRFPRRYLLPASQNVSGNLPRELTSFVGRQDELADIARMLHTAPLLTLVGVGGIGKTRLATRTAVAARERYAHGAWLVELAPVSNSAGVATEVARTLGIRERPGSTTVETLCDVLRGRQLLLVLDNCEHVVAACADLAPTLLQTCADLCILATSREALGVAGESVYRVPPLPVPRPEELGESLSRGTAIDLFVDRTRALEPTFELTQQTGKSVARICQLLDGLPLAIELAAARTITMSPTEIERRLDDPLRLLTVGPRSAPARQQTLRAAIDWSYQLLAEPEQTLLRRLAIFRGGFDRQAVAAVGTDGELSAAQVDDLLDRLVAQSLLVSVKQEERVRFHLLETVHQYCWSRLEEVGEVAHVRERHRDWCLSLVEGVVVESFDADEVARLQPDLENLRSALSWAIGSSQVDAAMRLAMALAISWFFHGSFSEGRSWLTAVFDLAATRSTSPNVPFMAAYAGSMAFNQGDFSGAEQLFHRAIDLAQASGNLAAVVYAESRLGRLAYQRGDLRSAKQLAEDALERLAANSSPWEAIVRGDLGFICLELGDTARAAELFRSISANATPAQSRFLHARLLNAQAHLAEWVADYAEANRLLGQAIDAERATGDQTGVLESLVLRGAVAVQCGDLGLAASVLLEALDGAVLFGTRMRLARLFEAIATLLADWQPEACVRLAAAAEQLRTTLGAVPLPSEQTRLGRYVQTAKQRLGQRAYGAIWADAPNVPLDTSLIRARELVLAFQAGRPPESPPAPSGGEGLSQREREVAILVTRGLSNREIAEELVVSGKTAEAHVAHILNKLGFTNRVQIATWGMRHRLDATGVGPIGDQVPL